MADQTFQKKLLPCVIAAALSGMAAPVFAAEAQKDSKKDSDVEVVEVRGIRETLKRNLADKRDAISIVDSVNAEDIGKFPDKNVAEALQRIPGVTTDRRFGEGNLVSIRGAGADLTLTTLNGQNVASTGWFVLDSARRTFNYELMPSELVSGLEVYKSSQADLAEGGIGGTVNVKTRKPLQLKPNTVFGSVEMQKQDDSGETDPQYAGLYSWKNDVGSFGFLVAYVDHTRNLLRRGNEAWWAWGAGPVGFESERHRTGLSSTLQFAPSDSLDFTLNYHNFEMDAVNTNYAFWLTKGGADTAKLHGTPVAGALGVAYYEVRPRAAKMESETVDFGFEYSGDRLTVDGRIGSTESIGGTKLETHFFDGTGGTAIPGGSYDFRGNTQTWNLGGGIGPDKLGFSTYVPSTLGLNTGAGLNRTPKEDGEDYVALNLRFEVDAGPIRAIKTGVRSSEHESAKYRFESVMKTGAVASVQTAKYRDGSIQVGTAGYSILHLNTAALRDYALSQVGSWKENLATHNRLSEDNLAVYAMAEYETGDVSGNFGLRYISTDASTNSYHLLTKKPQTDSASYDDILPSFNLKYAVNDKLVMRAAVSKVLARQNYDDLYTSPEFKGTNDSLNDNQFMIVGNVGLKPYVATQADFGLEWYYGDASYLSGGVFFKDVEGFITYSERKNVPSSEVPFDGFEPAYRCVAPVVCEQSVGWTVQNKSTNGKGDIRGLELGWQHTLENGFGGMFNYTYTDASADDKIFVDRNGMMSDSSKHAYNAVAFFENEKFGARLAYSWRDDYMVRETGGYGSRLIKAYGLLDFTAEYHLNEHIDLRFTAGNLTEETLYHVGNHRLIDSVGFEPGFAKYQYASGRTLSLGAQFRF